MAIRKTIMIEDSVNKKILRKQADMIRDSEIQWSYSAIVDHLLAKSLKL